jgi:hypothetical protein
VPAGLEENPKTMNVEWNDSGLLWGYWEFSRESEALHERTFVMHCHIWRTPFSFNRSAG